MPVLVIALVAGLLLPLILPSLPGMPAIFWSVQAVALVILCCFFNVRPILAFAGMVAAGSAWTLATAIDYNVAQLPPALDQCDWHLQGVVTGLPKADGHRIKFDFVPGRVEFIDCPKKPVAQYRRKRIGCLMKGSSDCPRTTITLICAQATGCN